MVLLFLLNILSLANSTWSLACKRKVGYLWVLQTSIFACNCSAEVLFLVNGPLMPVQQVSNKIKMHQYKCKVKMQVFMAVFQAFYQASGHLEQYYGAGAVTVRTLEAKPFTPYKRLPDMIQQMKAGVSSNNDGFTALTLLHNIRDNKSIY